MTKVTWKLKSGTTWRDKLEGEHPSHGKVVPISVGMQKRFGKGTMLIAKPREVDAVMRKARKGKLLIMSRLREEQAKRAEADQCCPMTTGIFIRIVAETAEEDRAAGKKWITPYWRTIRDNGSLNDKFPGGVKSQAKHLRAEGFVISPAKGKQPPRVKDYEKFLVKL